MLSVAINGRLLRPDKVDGIGCFTHEITKRLVATHPDVQFHLISDRKPEACLQFGPNVKQYRVLPPARRFYLYEMWYQYAIPTFLRGLKPDVFVSTDGFLPLQLSIPTVVVQHDLGWLAVPHQVDRCTSWYYAKRFPQCFRAGSKQATVSEFSRNQIADVWKVPAEQVSVVPNAARAIFVPLEEAAKVRYRDAYASGNRFLVFVGTIQPRKNIEGLLRGFDEACARGLDNTYLVVAGPRQSIVSVTDTLCTMRFANRVRFTGYLANKELAGVLASAEAMVYIPHYEGFGIPILEAMASGVPVICSRNSALPEVGGTAAYYVKDSGSDSVSEAIIEVASNAELHTSLVQAGIKRAAQFSWDTSAEKMWQLIEDAIAARE